MRATGTFKTCIWRWQQRFMEAGTDGLLVDKTRPSRIPPLGDAVTERVVALTLTDPLGETTHWTAAAVAATCSISISSVQRGVFHSIVALQAAINRFVKEANQNPKLFRWIKGPDEIIAALRRGHQALNPHH